MNYLILVSILLGLAILYVFGWIFFFALMVFTNYAYFGGRDMDKEGLLMAAGLALRWPQVVFCSVRKFCKEAFGKRSQKTT